MVRVCPPRSILRAFGIDAPPLPMSGGQGTAWLAGEVVLKPGAGRVQEWFGDVAATIAQEGFRLAMPVRSRGGAWTVDGWSATTWVPGDRPDLFDHSAWDTVMAAGRAFHRATAHLPRPDVLSTRTDRWALADQCAWGERQLELESQIADLTRRLTPLLRPLGDSQIVHGDLTGNVLVHHALSPAVIDVSPYWRPAAYAEGIVVADAMCWFNADVSLADRLDVPVPAVARALLFRLLTTDLQLDALAAADDDLGGYRRAIAALGA